jgi:hypothetical protein
MCLVPLIGLKGALTRAEDPPPQGVHTPAPDEIAAPVYYADTLLIVSTRQGVAAVAFGKPIEDDERLGVNYRYQFRAKDGTERSGKGELYEIRRLPVELNGVPEDEGSSLAQTVMRVGDIQIVWSRHSNEKGFVYYRPEDMRVQFAVATKKQARPPLLGRLNLQPSRIVDALKLIDLKRFAW